MMMGMNVTFVLSGITFLWDDESEREAGGIRIISARKATPQERTEYES
jgi:uncharacterized DUF497 family protein